MVSRTITTTITALAALLATAACDLDLQNPNAATEEEVTEDTDGLIAHAVGVQGRFADQIEEFVQGPALVTDEWGTGPRSLLSYRALLNGENFDNTLLVVEEPFAAAYQVINDANRLITHVPQVIEGPGLRAGLLSLAKLFKAMSLGMLYMQYEEVPIDLSDPDPTPAPRSAVISEVLSLLESARQDLQGISEEQLSGFRSRALAPGIDLENTIEAMLARYHLIAGNYMEAIAAAQRVDPTARSEFRYSAPNRNPIHDLSVRLEYVFPLLSFVEEAEPGDDRVNFWVDTSADPFTGNPDSLLLPLNRYSGAQEPFPIYLPDEMLLIRAEAHAWLDNLEQARMLINQVRANGAPPTANLPPLSDEELATREDILRQIAYERRYELYMQGLRWEDLRRLSAVVDERPTFQFLPFPQRECLANPSVGC